MIAGIGTDIVAVARIEAAIARHGEAFAHKILSVSELLEFTNATHGARFLAKRFAAKEAFAKATGQGLRHPVTMHNISVSHDELGKPLFVFDAALKQHLDELNISHYHLSISDERDTAVAFVILERKD